MARTKLNDLARDLTRDELATITGGLDLSRTCRHDLGGAYLSDGWSDAGLLALNGDAEWEERSAGILFPTEFGPLGE